MVYINTAGILYLACLVILGLMTLGVSIWAIILLVRCVLSAEHRRRTLQRISARGASHLWLNLLIRGLVVVNVVVAVVFLITVLRPTSAPSGTGAATGHGRSAADAPSGVAPEGGW